MLQQPAAAGALTYAQLPPNPPSAKKGKGKKKDKDAFLTPFTPSFIFTPEPIILPDDDLRWTERFRSGVFCFYHNQLGISFKNCHPDLIWDIERKYCTKVAVSKEVSHITCRVPIHPGTFVAIDAPTEQLVIMSSLLQIAQVVEDLLEAEATHQTDTECNRLRHRLNQLYDSFVPEYGLLTNCKSYYDSIWHDVRLEVYLTQLVDHAGNKSDIFRRRLKRPPQVLHGQQFFDEDLNQRLTRAYSWCMGWHGEVDIAEIAEKAGIDEDLALEILLKQGLIYREWVGPATNWWELLVVDESISSMYRLKLAYKAQAKIHHPDINPETGSIRMMQLINEAYEQGQSIVLRRQPEVPLKQSKALLKVTDGEILIDGLLGKYLAVCIVPDEYKVKGQTTRQFALVDIEKKRPLAIFYNQAAAIACLQELENNYALAWQPGHPDYALAWEVIEFYKNN